MNVIGRPVSEMPPEQIILVARAGSHLYDLATADSDADYVVVYAEPLQVTLLARCHTRNVAYQMPLC